MSLQDDIFDVSAALEGKPEASALERIWQHLYAVEKREEEQRQTLADLRTGIGAIITIVRETRT